MEKEMLDDKTLDKVAGGSEFPTLWTCPQCGKPLLVRSIEEVQNHLKKCSQNPLLPS